MPDALRPPTGQGLRELWLQTVDGVPLRAEHRPARHGHRTDLLIVLGHGFTGAASEPATRRIAAGLAAAGDVLALDFRGHGRSGGRSTVGGNETEDVEAAVRWAREQGAGAVATVGFSMGASIVVRHAGLYGGVDAVVSVSGPARWYYRGTRPMRRVHLLIETRPGRLVARGLLGVRVADGWDTVPLSPRELAPRIAPVPLLVVHGDADAYLPVDHPRELVACAGPNAELWLERGMGHAENAATPDLIDRIGRWLLDTLPPVGDVGGGLGGLVADASGAADLAGP